MPAAVVIGVGDGVALGQDGEVEREKRNWPADWTKAKISTAGCGRSGAPVDAGMRLCSPSCRSSKNIPPTPSRFSAVCDVKVLIALFFKGGV